MLCQSTPRNGVAVEGLDASTTPMVTIGMRFPTSESDKDAPSDGTLHRGENIPMRRDDGSHENVVDESANNSAETLHCKCHPGRKLGVLSHLEVPRHGTTLLRGVVGVQGEIPS